MSNNDDNNVDIDDISSTDTDINTNDDNKYHYACL